MARAGRELPKKLYVRWEYPDHDLPYLTCAEVSKEMLESPSDKKIVGVYELKKKVQVESRVTVSSRK